tara:strand:- start:7218 stop:8528 length:1311 start_codon:yes stop_codon:yes gene_type:complete
MFRFGYDKFDDTKWEIVEPNGLIDQEKEPEVFRLYLPPWYGDFFKRYDIPFKIKSSESLIKGFGEFAFDSKWIYLLEPNGDPRGWFGQYTEEDSDVNPIKSLLGGVDKKTLQSCRDGKTLICLYQPNEGFPTNWLGFNIFEEIYIELGEQNINPNNFMFVCGNMKLESDFKEWKNKKSNKHKNSGDIHVCGFNNERYIDYHSKWSLAEFNSDMDRKKHFLCFNRELRPHRKLLLTMLLQENLLDCGLVSSKKFDKETFFRVPNELFIGSGVTKRLEKYVDELVEMTPLVVDVDEWDTNHFDTSPKWAYDNTYFSVVTNTWYDMDTQFLDEKVWKAIANRHPFIVVGNYKILEELRRQGFKTFSPLIDESYDLEQHPYKRMKLIIKEIKRLSELSMEEMNDWYKEFESILNHNYETLFSTDLLDRFVEKLSHATKIE